MTLKSTRERRVTAERRAHPRGGRRSSDNDDGRQRLATLIAEYLSACPKCFAPRTRWLAFTSLASQANAFQCMACGHLFVMSRSLPAEPA